MRTLILVDGQIDKPDYARFEAAMVNAASEIAAKPNSEASNRLTEALANVLA